MGRWERCGERGKIGNARAGGFLFSFLGEHRQRHEFQWEAVSSTVSPVARLVAKTLPTPRILLLPGDRESGLWGQKCGRFLLLPTD